MASIARSEQLNELVKQAGSIRKASQLILDLKGVAPSKSVIDRALKGSGSDYFVQTIIDDLTLSFAQKNKAIQ